MVTKKILLGALLAGGLFGAFQAQAMEAARELTNGEGSGELIRLEKLLQRDIAEFQTAKAEYNTEYAKALENKKKETDSTKMLNWMSIFFGDIEGSRVKMLKCERRVSETEARIKALKKALR